MNFTRKQQVALQPYNPEVFDVTNLENEISDALQQSIKDNAPPAPPTITQIGTVTAEAVMTQYEAAATTINQMKEPMQQWVTECEKALADLKAAMSYIDETAQKFRQMGQETHDKIVQSSAAITEVRQTCDSIRQKIAP